ncbi:MAG: hypothetical protein ACYDHH_28995 [Solirubrobacteraceae bacterium]
MRTVAKTRFSLAVPAALAATLALSACGSSAVSPTTPAAGSTAGVTVHKGTHGKGTHGKGTHAKGTHATQPAGAAGTLQSQLGPAGASSATSAGRLKALAAALHHPIFWASNRVPGSVRVTRFANGSTLVSYVLATSGRRYSLSQLVSIGTYHQPDAAHTIELGLKRAGSRSSVLPGGEIVLVRADHPFSAYVAPAGQPGLLVEVYAPRAGQALALLTSGAIQPIG